MADANAAATTGTLGQPAPLALKASIPGEFWRYLSVSLVALGLDFGLLCLLTERAHLHYLNSAAISYSAGAVLHYALSVSFVFRHRPVADRRLEFVGFFVIGLMGLAANQLVMQAAVAGLGLGYVLGKGLATGVGFVLTFAARRVLLFTNLRRTA